MWRLLLHRNFFGLADNYAECMYEQMFSLKHHGGWSLIELYNLPVGLRNWFTERLVKELKQEAENSRK